MNQTILTTMIVRVLNEAGVLLRLNEQPDDFEKMISEIRNRVFRAGISIDILRAGMPSVTDHIRGFLHRRGVVERIIPGDLLVVVSCDPMDPEYDSSLTTSIVGEIDRLKKVVEPSKEEVVS